MKRAGVERFQRRFDPIQPAYANRLGRCDPAEEVALAVEPPTNGTAALDYLSNSLLQAEQRRQPLSCQLLRVCSPSPPTLECSPVAIQRLRQLLFSDT